MGEFGSHSLRSHLSACRSVAGSNRGQERAWLPLWCREEMAGWIALDRMVDVIDICEESKVEVSSFSTSHEQYSTRRQ